MGKKELEGTLQENPASETMEGRGSEETIERPYTLRKLKDRDLFPLLKILKKIKIKDYKDAFIQIAAKNYGDTFAQTTEDEAALDEMAEKKDSDDVLEQIGIMTVFDMADILIEKLPIILDEAYELWSDISGISVEEIKDMEFGTLPLMIVDTFSEARNTSFFKVLSKFLS